MNLPRNCSGGFVYVVAAQDRLGLGGPVKIGVSKNPQARIASLQTGSWSRLVLCSTTWDENAEELERLVHQRLSELKRRVCGEWFRASAYEAMLIIYMCSYERFAPRRLPIDEEILRSCIEGKTKTYLRCQSHLQRTELLKMCEATYA